jgi:flagellar assembly protein FliH
MATILKQDQIRQSGETPRAISFNTEDVHQRAQAYLDQVRLQGQEIIAQAQREAAQVRAAARAAGLQDAQKDLAKQIEEASLKLTEDTIRTATAACQQSLNSLSADTQQWLQEWRDVTVDMAIAMAEKLVRQSMAHGVEPLRVWLEEALMLMRDARDVHILVHPDDFTWAGRYLQQMAKHVPHAGSAEVLPDPTVSRGGCVVRCQHGQVDQQLETQLARLGEQLK